MSEIELKPCPSPSCGSVAVYIRHVDDLHYVVCSDCVLNGPMSRTSEKEAVALWNELPRAAAYQPESSPVQLPEFVAPAVEYPRRRGRRADWKKQRPIEPALAEILLEACEAAHVPAQELAVEIIRLHARIKMLEDVLETSNSIISGVQAAANIPAHVNPIHYVKDLRLINDAVKKWMSDYNLTGADELKTSLDEKEAILEKFDCEINEYYGALNNIRKLCGIDSYTPLLIGIEGILKERDELRSALRDLVLASTGKLTMDDADSEIEKAKASWSAVAHARELIR